MGSAEASGCGRALPVHSKPDVCGRVDDGVGVECYFPLGVGGIVRVAAGHRISSAGDLVRGTLVTTTVWR